MRHSSPYGAPATCTLISVDLDRKLLALVEDRDVRLFAAIPWLDGRQRERVADKNFSVTQAGRLKAGALASLRYQALTQADLRTRGLRRSSGEMV
jgi:hypothetical protein